MPRGMRCMPYKHSMNMEEYLLEIEKEIGKSKQIRNIYICFINFTCQILVLFFLVYLFYVVTKLF